MNTLAQQMTTATAASVADDSVAIRLGNAQRVVDAAIILPAAENGRFVLSEFLP